MVTLYLLSRNAYAVVSAVHLQVELDRLQRSCYKHRSIGLLEVL